MSDIEQTMRDIKRCIYDMCSGCSHHCDREAFPDCMEKLLDDAYQLLKAQRPIEPNYHGLGIHGARYTCGACRHKIYRNDNYCHNCGRPVKWG